MSRGLVEAKQEPTLRSQEQEGGWYGWCRGKGMWSLGAGIWGMLLVHNRCSINICH